jgi:hypothetical protein
VTLILTVHDRESIWMLADRRLSCKGRSPKDDARKVMLFETTDGVAILGYAGVGATALGTEPADWMAAVLRGRNLPLEQSLGVVARAMKPQLPRHMLQMPRGGIPSHNLLATAIVNNEVRLYTVDLAVAPDGSSCHFRHTRWVVDQPTTAPARTPRLAISGSGGLYLYGNKKWTRPLLHLVGACDRGKVSPYAVADHLARLNNQVRLAVADKSVGPRCIVTWQHKKGGIHKMGGDQ